MCVTGGNVDLEVVRWILGEYRVECRAVSVIRRGAPRKEGTLCNTTEEWRLRKRKEKKHKRKTTKRQASQEERESSSYWESKQGTSGKPGGLVHAGGCEAGKLASRLAELARYQIFHEDTCIKSVPSYPGADFQVGWADLPGSGWRPRGPFLCCYSPMCS